MKDSSEQILVMNYILSGQIPVIFIRYLHFLDVYTLTPIVYLRYKSNVLWSKVVY